MELINSPPVPTRYSFLQRPWTSLDELRNDHLRSAA